MSNTLGVSSENACFALELTRDLSQGGAAEPVRVKSFPFSSDFFLTRPFAQRWIQLGKDRTKHSKEEVEIAADGTLAH